ncbi:Hypothetical predicted protein [Olea europaea subsp. europaea]|uniref:Uncharacterized protein n=1 Tax=Olea europaea subsp. europaea TaxID=158383 RepID=A0A8S0RQU2_OLEEU|nr:Hypothetical predicted protein [Olea europaea subsp. europaea]
MAVLDTTAAVHRPCPTARNNSSTPAYCCALAAAGSESYAVAVMPLQKEGSSVASLLQERNSGGCCH